MKNIEYIVSICSPLPTWLDLGEITAWKAVWVESGMLSLSAVLTGDNNGQGTGPNSCQWNRAFVNEVLCLSSVFMLFHRSVCRDNIVWNRQRMSQSSSLDCKAHSLSYCLSISDHRKVRCLCWWSFALCFTCFCFFVLFCLFVCFRKQHNCQFKNKFAHLSLRVHHYWMKKNLL